MLVLISRFDDLMQKAVDHAAFFLMRRFGWRKAYIRYCLAALACVSMGGILMASVRAKGFDGGLIIMILLLAAMMAMTHFSYSRDSSHEGKNAILYPADVRRLSSLTPFKCLWFFFLCRDIVDTVRGPLPGSKVVGAMFTFTCVCYLAWDIAMILEHYLVKTPRIPPPLEEKKAVLVPAYATSRR
jgi:hypothetical protein